MLRFLHRTRACAILVCALGCTDKPDRSTGPNTDTRCLVTSLSVLPRQASLPIGGTLHLAAPTVQEGCEAIATSWESAAPTVLAVSGNGTITGIALGGPIVVTARLGSVTATAAYSVTARIATVSFAPATLTLVVGQVLTPTVVMRDEQGMVVSGRQITWSTSNSSVAAVSEAGAISGVGPGQATVTALIDSRPANLSVTVTATASAVATVTVSPVTASLAVGQSQTIAAVARDAQGNTVSGRPVSWSSSSPTVASVALSGVVTAVAPGQATITATIDGRQASAAILVSSPAPQQAVLTVTNELLYPINLSTGGTSLGSVPSQSTRTATIAATASMRVDWTLVRPTLDGRALGDPMTGFWNLSNPSGTVPLTVDNIVGAQSYFAPAVTNTTGVKLAMAANLGLASENRCNCSIPSDGVPTVFGYYRLYSNSTLAAFRDDGSNYTGSYRIFSDFATGVTRGSGRLGFTFRVAP